MKPITPSEVGATKASIFPPEVFQSFNELIASHCVNGAATFRQDEVIERMWGLMYPGMEGTGAGEQVKSRWRREVFSEGWLNVEDAYRAAGWKVEYDKPGYNETYEATFTFSS